MAAPQIDVLMAVYNGHRYIEPQIESILNQTHRNIRLIIRDDSSKDKSQEILRHWQKKHYQKIQVIYSETNLGIIGNFEELMKESKAPYVMFADQDDVWRVDKAARTLAKMQELERENPGEQPLLVHTDLRVVDKELREVAPSFWDYAGLFPHRKATLGRQITQNNITGCTVMINRPLLEMAMPIPKNSIVMHDWWLGLVASAFGKIGIVPEQTILYRQHGANEIGAKQFSWSSFKRSQAHKGEVRKQTQKQAQAFLDRYGAHLSVDKKNIVEAYMKMQKSWLSFERGYLMLKFGLYKQGILRNLNQFLLG